MQTRLEETLDGSPYSLRVQASIALESELNLLADRVQTLRAHGRLSRDTLKRYFGQTRYQQVAESNAIEGSTLNVGETQLAILKGVTLTGHDPAFVRDAISLDKALTKLNEIATSGGVTDIATIKEIHALVLEGRPDAGVFRTVPVRLSGSDHRPPKTWEGVMSGMESLQQWSTKRIAADPLVRSCVLHAWLSHIHPFLDGNGRTARALSTLELIRAGYPPLIIRKTQDRDRYINALQDSDAGGDISHLFDLFLERFHAALIGLENAAKEIEHFDPASIKLQRAQQRTLEVWNRSVELLYQIVVDRLATTVEGAGGTVIHRLIRDALSFDEYVELSKGLSVPRSWAFTIRVTAPGLKTIDRLAWIGFRSEVLLSASNDRAGRCPSIFWSKPNSAGFPPWIKCTDDGPGVSEMSITPGTGDNWHVLLSDGRYVPSTTTELAQRIKDGFVRLMSD